MTPFVASCSVLSVRFLISRIGIFIGEPTLSLTLAMVPRKELLALLEEETSCYGLNHRQVDLMDKCSLDFPNICSDVAVLIKNRKRDFSLLFNGYCLADRLTRSLTGVAYFQADFICSCLFICVSWVL